MAQRARPLELESKVEFEELMVACCSTSMKDIGSDPALTTLCSTPASRRLSPRPLIAHGRRACFRSLPRSKTGNPSSAQRPRRDRGHDVQYRRPGSKIQQVMRTTASSRSTVGTTGGRARYWLVRSPDWIWAGQNYRSHPEGAQKYAFTRNLVIVSGCDLANQTPIWRERSPCRTVGRRQTDKATVFGTAYPPGSADPGAPATANFQNQI